MSPTPPVGAVFRQMWPKGQVREPRQKRGPALTRETVAAIRRGEMTIAEGARIAGITRSRLDKRVWCETKADVLARDGSCVVCLSMDMLDVHHRHGRRAGGTSNPRIAYGMDNLLALCRPHHDYCEQHPDWARGHGLRVDTGQNPADVEVTYHGRRVLLGDDGSVAEVPS